MCSVLPPLVGDGGMFEEAGEDCPDTTEDNGLGSGLEPTIGNGRPLLGVELALNEEEPSRDGRTCEDVCASEMGGTAVGEVGRPGLIVVGVEVSTNELCAAEVTAAADGLDADGVGKL